MKAGDIIWTHLPETGDCVQTGVRPCIILGNTAACKFSPVVTVIPVSTRVDKKVPSHIPIRGLKKESIALTEQIQTINKNCLSGSPIHSLNKDELNKIKEALSAQFGL